MGTLNQDNALAIQNAMQAALADPVTGLASAVSGSKVEVSGFDKSWQHFRKRVDFAGNSGLSKGCIVWLQYRPQRPEFSGAGVVFTNKVFWTVRVGCPILDQNWVVDSTYLANFDLFRSKAKEILLNNRSWAGKAWYTEAWDSGWFVEQGQPPLFVMDIHCEVRFTSYMQ